MTSTVLQYPSPGLALGAGLQQAIAKLFPRASSALSLRRAEGVDATVYLSPVALGLARQAQGSALEVAEQLLTLLAESPIAQLDIQPQIHPPGWLVWTLPDPQIAAWLQQLMQTPPCRLWDQDVARLSSPQIMAETTDSLVFELHYSHARCCSLLRLGQERGLIQLNATPWRIKHPQTLPWLTSDNQLRLEDPAEQALIRELLDLPLRSLEVGRVLPHTREHTWSLPLAPQRLEQQARTVSAAFQTFYRCCPMGRGSQQSLAQARLGLIQTASFLFRFLIQELFNSEALLEL